MSQEIRQRSEDFQQRVERVLQPVGGRRATARAAREIARAARRLAERYRLASLARTDEEFGAEVNRAVDAVDEAVLWLEMLRLTAAPPTHDLDGLIAEGQELAGLIAGVAPPSVRRATVPERKASA
jgi:hypothetical protein